MVFRPLDEVNAGKFLRVLFPGYSEAGRYFALGLRVSVLINMVQLVALVWVLWQLFVQRRG